MAFPTWIISPLISLSKWVKDKINEFKKGKSDTEKEMLALKKHILDSENEKTHREKLLSDYKINTQYHLREKDGVLYCETCLVGKGKPYQVSPFGDFGFKCPECGAYYPKPDNEISSFYEPPKDDGDRGDTGYGI